MTENELRRMQEQALRRTREMQRRAEEARLNSQPQPAVGSYEEQPRPALHPHEEQPDSRKPDQPLHAPVNVPQEHKISSTPVTRAEQHNNSAAEKGSALEFLFRDKEKTLILGLMLLLMDEKTDNGLLLALMYLLM